MQMLHFFAFVVYLKGKNQSFNELRLFGLKERAIQNIIYCRIFLFLIHYGPCQCNMQQDAAEFMIKNSKIVANLHAPQCSNIV